MKSIPSIESAFYTFIPGLRSIFSIVLYLILFSTVYHELDYDLKPRPKKSPSASAYLDLERITDFPCVHTTIAEEHKYSGGGGLAPAAAGPNSKENRLDRSTSIFLIPTKTD